MYVSIKGGLHLMTADGGDACGEVFAVPPNQRHTIASDFRSAIFVIHRVVLAVDDESMKCIFREGAARRRAAGAAQVRFVVGEENLRFSRQFECVRSQSR